MMMQAGERAPDFQIEVANGPAVILSELWQTHQVLLWFGRGLACPFCRRQMVQVAQIYNEIKATNTELVAVMPTPLETARRMMEFFPVAWPYGCDPAFQVVTAYQMQVNRDGLLNQLTREVKEQTHSWGVALRHPLEPHPAVLPLVTKKDDPPMFDGGLVIVGQGGWIRCKRPSGKVALLPSNDQILQLVRESAAAALPA
jgi:peroxiredoxin